MPDPSRPRELERRLPRRLFLTLSAAATAAIAVAAEELGDVVTSDLQPIIDRATFGAFAANEPWPDLSAHYQLEQDLDVRLETMSWFLGFDSGLPQRQATAAAESGHDLLLCWQPSLSGNRPVPYADILAGRWDRRMDRFFRQCAAYPRQVTIRFAHEMNLVQMPQSILNANPCTTSLNEWLDTWRYVVDRQRAIGGNNVQWMWCVSGIDMGGIAAESYWPGADYVDVIGMDVYNGYGPWTPATKLINPMYQRMTALHPSAPIWLAEIGCRGVDTTESFNKADWWRIFFASPQFERLTHIIFFNANKERDWRISTADVAASMSGHLKQNATRLVR